MSKVWLLPLAVTLLLYGIYHLRDDLYYQPKTVKRHKPKSSKKVAPKAEKLSEQVPSLAVHEALSKLSDTIDEKFAEASQDSTKKEKTWKERKAEKKASRVKVIASDEVRAEQEQVLAQLALRNSMHAQMTERYVQVRVFITREIILKIRISEALS